MFRFTPKAIGAVRSVVRGPKLAIAMSVRSNLWRASAILFLTVSVLRSAPAEIDTACTVKIRRGSSSAAESLLQPPAGIFLSFFGLLNHRCHAEKFVRHALIHLALDPHAGLFQGVFQHYAIAKQRVD